MKYEEKDFKLVKGKDGSLCSEKCFFYYRYGCPEWGYCGKKIYQPKLWARVKFFLKKVAN